MYKNLDTSEVFINDTDYSDTVYSKLLKIAKIEGIKNTGKEDILKFITCNLYSNTTVHRYVITKMVEKIVIYKYMEGINRLNRLYDSLNNGVRPHYDEYKWDDVDTSRLTDDPSEDVSLTKNVNLIKDEYLKSKGFRINRMGKITRDLISLKSLLRDYIIANQVDTAIYRELKSFLDINCISLG